MFDRDVGLQKLTSKEKPVREVIVEFERKEHFNALITEFWCPLQQRLQAAKESTCIKQVIVLCETDKEALDTVQYHFYSTGSNFRIIGENEK